MVYCAGKLIGNLKYFIKAIDTLSVGLLALFPLGMLGKHSEELVNHSPSARYLQAFLVFSQHPASVITPVNP